MTHKVIEGNTYDLDRNGRLTHKKLPDDPEVASPSEAAV